MAKITDGIFDGVMDHLEDVGSDVQEGSPDSVTVKHDGRKISMSNERFNAAAREPVRMAQVPGRQLALPDFLPDTEDLANTVTSAVQALASRTVDKGQVAAMSSVVETAIEFETARGVPMVGILKISLKAKPRPPEK